VRTHTKAEADQLDPSSGQRAHPQSRAPSAASCRRPPRWDLGDARLRRRGFGRCRSSPLCFGSGLTARTWPRTSERVPVTAGDLHGAHMHAMAAVARRERGGEDAMGGCGCRRETGEMRWEG
jgi:hypothetical protein